MALPRVEAPEQGLQQRGPDEHVVVHQHVPLRPGERERGEEESLRLAAPGADRVAREVACGARGEASGRIRARSQRIDG